MNNDCLLHKGRSQVLSTSHEMGYVLHHPQPADDVATTGSFKDAETPYGNVLVNASFNMVSSGLM